MGPTTEVQKTTRQLDTSSDSLLTKSSATSTSENDFFIQPPQLSLPKGGGAIRGMGEKFAANPVNGSGSMSVPIPLSPGRGDFAPELSLSYNSASGNGPFGFGWSLSLPSITRKTDKGLPRYLDTIESDVFILSGAEDLVPVLNEQGTFTESTIENAGVTYQVHRFRPRIEGLFARIERWTSDTGDVHWRSYSKENILTIYGLNEHSRIIDPDDKKRIFSWLICETRDDKGNAILYRYQAENDDNVISKLNEKNRLKTANRYLKSILYGNKTPLLDSQGNRPHFRKNLVDDLDDDRNWHFSVVFDYGEGHYQELEAGTDTSHRIIGTLTKSVNKWHARQDSFSSYRSGFEVRTYRRCENILLFHHFENELGEPYLVRGLTLNYQDFDYTEQSPDDINRELNFSGSTKILSRCVAITQSGYVRIPGQSNIEGIVYPRYIEQSLPSLKFEYSQAIIQEKKESLMDQASEHNLPVGVDGTNYQWVDLDGEGLSGVLTRQAGAWHYKANLGNGKLAALKTLPSQPSLFTQATSVPRFLDLYGDGQLDIVSFADGGFYERTADEGWSAFHYFKTLPNVNWRDPNLRFIDLNGDGHSDILITEDNVFTWYPSKAEAGFGASQQSHQDGLEEQCPKILFADQTQSIYLADMSGDGLTDILRLRNGNISYWPNLGYGRFGKKVNMDDAPRFDYSDIFNQSRILLADIDGSGTTDIIYLSDEGPKLYFNYSGNGWSRARLIEDFPPIDSLSNITTTDLKGNGTACLVWSSPLNITEQKSLSYIDLMGGNKPHLLTGVNNNLGAETRVHYVASTQFYLKDKEEGKPWITKIPFPVHVIERVETLDHISHSRFTTRYAYHHGYFDGHEREFRGFSMVEQWDTEEYQVPTYNINQSQPGNQQKASYTPPVYTKTWYHTGIYQGRETVSNFFAGTSDTFHQGEYFREPHLNSDTAEKFLLPDTVLPPDLSFAEEREACRALKGNMLRQEVYAEDNTDKASIPFTVTEQNFSIQRLQEKHNNTHAVFLTHPRETLTYHYERNPVDPRIQHSITLEVDRFGNVVKQVTIGYGRRERIYAKNEANQLVEIPNPALDELDAEDRLQQTQHRITYTENTFTNAINNNQTYVFDYRTPQPSETLTYELTGYPITDTIGRYTISDFIATDNSNNRPAIHHRFDEEIPYHQQATNHRQRRLVEHLRILYRKDNLSGLLSLGQLEPKALPGESYKLAFTQALLDTVYQQTMGNNSNEALINNPESILPIDDNNVALSDRGGYVNSQGLKPLFPTTDPDKHWWIPSGRSYFSPTANIRNNAISAAQELNEAKAHFYLPRKYTTPFYQSQTLNYVYDLLPQQTVDALNNRVQVEYDFRVLQPHIITDVNNNQQLAHYDALGMVVATAIAGKANENLGDHLQEFTNDIFRSESDLTPNTQQVFFNSPKNTAATYLKNASTRFIYDLLAFVERGKAPYSASVVRETHTHQHNSAEPLKIQVSFNYSDGFGRALQQKKQAEPGEVPQRDSQGALILNTKNQPLKGPNPNPDRWVGSGWMIYNNKGKPVQQFEPFFSDTHQLDRDAAIGVSPYLFYDPLGRVIATLQPNHTYEKTQFTPWRQEVWDSNDTITLDCRDDPQIQNYVKHYFEHIAPDRQRWQTWLQQQGVDKDNPPPDSQGQHPEQDAAVRALPHANTPTISHLDTLGRPFLSIADNGSAGRYATCTYSDIEGNPIQITDALGRIVMRYHYHLAGPEKDENGEPTNTHQMYQHSMDAGERWVLNDINGQPIRQWDSRGHELSFTYDPLRRLRHTYVEGKSQTHSDSTVLNRKTCIQMIEYGEAMANAERQNLRSQIYKTYDAAGCITHIAYDFKGNLLTSERQLVDKFNAQLNANTQASIENPIDWQQPQSYEPQTYTTSHTYDALNRPSTITTPDNSIIYPNYNEAGLLEKLSADLQGEGKRTHFINNINYDAKGQRELIEYHILDTTGSAKTLTTHYQYDAKTFRLTNLTTRKTIGSPSRRKLQDLNYYYDPVGKITQIQNQASDIVYFNNTAVQPQQQYRYDALYRLTQASGREHQSQPRWASANNSGRTQFAIPHDGQALQTYTEEYQYDAVGNFLQLVHKVNGTTQWRREYNYRESSPIETNQVNNRLSQTRIIARGINQPEDYHYDSHGNMLTMPQLASMQWNFNDQMIRSQRQAINNNDVQGQTRQGENTYYVYDAGGQRVRKVTYTTNGQLKEQRIYLDGYEIYKKHQGNHAGLERQTLHIMDGQQRIALVETRNAIDDGSDTRLIRYQLNDHLGSSSIEVNYQGIEISYEECYPYGATAYQAKNRTINATAKRYRYTGKEKDEESELYYYGARYYAPWLGRWAAADPAGLVDGVNVFVYVKNNPINFLDPLGKYSIDINKNLRGLGNIKGGYKHSKEFSISMVKHEEYEVSLSKNSKGGSFSLFLMTESNEKYGFGAALMEDSAKIDSKLGIGSISYEYVDKENVKEHIFSFKADISTIKLLKNLKGKVKSKSKKMSEGSGQDVDFDFGGSVEIQVILSENKKEGSFKYALITKLEGNIKFGVSSNKEDDLSKSGLKDDSSGVAKELSLSLSGDNTIILHPDKGIFYESQIEADVKMSSQYGFLGYESSFSASGSIKSDRSIIQLVVGYEEKLMQSTK